METNNRSITDENALVQKRYLKSLIVHASDCYKLMTNPLRKSDELSETTKTWLKEKAVEEVLGLRKQVDSKPMIKGTLCKDDSIDLYNNVMGTNYKKNSIIKERHAFSGKPNLLGDDCAIKIVTSWDASTFPFFQDEVDKLIRKSGYDWLCRVYMMTTGMSKAIVSYCLVDTPIMTTDGDQLLMDGADISLHRFDGIVDAQKRVTNSKEIVRDLSIEQQMLDRHAIASRYYLNYLNELYHK